MTEQLDWLAGGLPPFDVGEQHLEPIPLDKDHLTRPEELVAEPKIYYVTENYPIQAGLVSRLLYYYYEENGVEDSTSAEVASRIGISFKQMRGLSSFSAKLCLINRNRTPLPFGKIIHKFDPYLLDIGVLWFLHYLLDSSAQVVIWSRLFNQVFFQKEEITTTDFISLYPDAKGRMTEDRFRKNIVGESRAVLLTYSDYLFKPLGVVLREDERHFYVVSDTFDIPPLIWLASILAYRERYYPGAATLETHLITEAHFSPGRLFRQNEKTVRAALDALHNLGLLTVERNLGLDQVRFKDGVTWLGAVARHLQEGQ